MLDSMMGSGTALVEVATLGRRGLGFDIDPLAVRITQAKMMLNICDLNDEKCDVVGQSRRLPQDTDLVESAIQSRFDDDTKKFIDYWFLLDTQRELMTLMLTIEKIADSGLRRILELTFSSIHRHKIRRCQPGDGPCPRTTSQSQFQNAAQRNPAARTKTSPVSFVFFETGRGESRWSDGPTGHGRCQGLAAR